MHASIYFLAKNDPLFVLTHATLEGKLIICTLVIFSIFAWSVMASKAVQMRRAKRLNTLFESEFRTQKRVMMFMIVGCRCRIVRCLWFITRVAASWMRG